MFADPSLPIYTACGLAACGAAELGENVAGNLTYFDFFQENGKCTVDFDSTNRSGGKCVAVLNGNVVKMGSKGRFFAYPAFVGQAFDIDLAPLPDDPSWIKWLYWCPIEMYPSINLSWTDVTDAAEYEILYAAESDKSDSRSLGKFREMDNLVVTNDSGNGAEIIVSGTTRQSKSYSITVNRNGYAFDVVYDGTTYSSVYGEPISIGDGIIVEVPEDAYWGTADFTISTSLQNTFEMKSVDAEDNYFRIKTTRANDKDVSYTGWGLVSVNLPPETVSEMQVEYVSDSTLALAFTAPTLDAVRYEVHVSSQYLSGNIIPTWYIAASGACSSEEYIQLPLTGLDLASAPMVGILVNTFDETGLSSNSVDVRYFTKTSDGILPIDTMKKPLSINAIPIGNGGVVLEIYTDGTEDGVKVYRDDYFTEIEDLDVIARTGYFYRKIVTVPASGEYTFYARCYVGSRIESNTIISATVTVNCDAVGTPTLTLEVSYDG
jgi:hypothetical protein